MNKALRAAVMVAAFALLPRAAEAQAAQIRSYLDGLPRLAAVPARAAALSDATDLPIGLSGTRRAGGSYVNTSAELTLLRPAPDAVWPGALVQGGTVADHLLTPIPLARAPGRVRVASSLVRSPPTAQPQALATMTASAVDAARAATLKTIGTADSAAATTPTTPTAITLASAGTVREGLVKLGVVYPGHWPAWADSRLATRYHESSMLVKFTQVFYTVGFDPEPNAADPFFAPAVTLADVQRYTSAANPPLFVSEVRYGRVLLFVVTASMSPADLAATVTAAHHAFDTGLSADDKARFDTLSIRLLSVTEPGGLALSPLPVRSGADTFSALREQVQNGGRYSPANPGGAIAFTLRYAGSKGTGDAPDGPAIVPLATDESPQLVALTASKACQANVSVWDGEGGGWVKTGWQANPGDRLSFSATGKTWSGVYATGSHGPAGWAGWETPKSGQRGFPLTNRPPYALIGRLGEGDNKGRDLTGGATTYSVGSERDIGAAFYIGAAAELVAGAGPYAGLGDVWLGINDEEPTNGDKKEKFSVEVCVTRKAW